MGETKLIGTLAVISLGPVVEDLITPRARTMIADCDVLYLMARDGNRTHQIAQRLVAGKPMELYFPIGSRLGEYLDDPGIQNAADRMVRDMKAGKRAGLLIFGDWSVYSPFGFFERALAGKGVAFDFTPGISFMSIASSAVGEMATFEADNALLAKAINIDALEDVFQTAESAVIYSAGPEFLEEARVFARRNAFMTARQVFTGNDGSVEKSYDLLTGEGRPNGGILIMRRRPGEFAPRPTVYLMDSEIGDAVPRTTEWRGLYRTVGETELFYSAHLAERSAPALLMFHAGGWKRGSRRQFDALGEMLAALGVSLISFDYRLGVAHSASPADCLSDARAAILWAIEAADDLGIDLDRVALGGASAGGHLSLGAAILPGDDAAATRIRELAKGYVLYNPVTETGDGGYGQDYLLSFDLDPENHDLTRHLAVALPPCITFHGDADELVPVENSVRFHATATELGVDSRLHLYAGAPHGFFNFGFNGSNRHFYDTSEKLVRFLVDLNFLTEAAVQKFGRMQAAEQTISARDILDSNRQVTNALQDVEAMLGEIRDAASGKRSPKDRDAVDMKRALNNVKTIMAKLNEVKRIHSFTQF